MQTRMARLTLSTAAIAFALSAHAVAEPKMDPPAQDSGISQGLHPDATHPVTSADIAECMKSWDPQTQMSRQEYEAACKRSLKYYPEQPN